ncbi:MFS transporter [Kutzneria sp. NPDC052558]|uniref:MFS transporter n=1 Tax=Kutzneria sp. NPDC052558 TaxID=3364121 RepID=UPI0037C91E91
MTDTHAATPAAGVAGASRARRWWVFALLCVTQLMIVLDGTVVNIALPSAQRALHFDDGNRQWIITAYTLTFGSLLLLAGRLADLIGQRTTLAIGLAGFAAASAVGGASTDFTMLVAARAVQGGFAALLAPAILALLTTTFTQGTERSRAFGVFGAIASGGASVGLLLGGVLTEYLSWRWTMYVNILFAVPALLGTFRLLPPHNPEHRPKLDVPGTVTVSAGLVALVYGVSDAQAEGWGSTTTVGCLIAAVVLLTVFVLLQRHGSDPLLPLRLLLDRDRAGALLTMSLAISGMFGIFLFVTYYMQVNLGYSAVETGVAFLPLPGTLVLMTSVIGPPISRRVGPKILVPLGMALGAASLLWLMRIGVQGNYFLDLFPTFAVFGVALGLIFSATPNLATLGVEEDDAGAASAMVNTVQQVGGSIGTALLNTVAAAAAAGWLAGRVPTAALSGQAQIHSYITAFAWGAGIFAVGAVIALVMLRPGVPAGFTDAEQPIVVH